MAIKSIDEVSLPYDELVIRGGDPDELAEYLRDLVNTLKERLEAIINATNLTVDLVSGAAVYYALKDKDGNYSEGTWRRMQVGDNLEDQVLLGDDSVTGTWTTVFTRERPQ